MISFCTKRTHKVVPIHTIANRKAKVAEPDLNLCSQTSSSNVLPHKHFEPRTISQPYYKTTETNPNPNPSYLLKHKTKHTK